MTHANRCKSNAYYVTHNSQPTEIFNVNQMQRGNLDKNIHTITELANSIRIVQSQRHYAQVMH